MIKAIPGNFFSQPYAVLNVHTCMEKVNRDIPIVGVAIVTTYAVKIITTCLMMIGPLFSIITITVSD